MPPLPVAFVGTASGTWTVERLEAVSGSALPPASHLRVVDGLRIFDASVVPRIPGFFVASAVYMISEEASDVLIRDHTAAGARTS